MIRGQSFAIHAVGEQRLRMKSVGHVDTLKQCAHNRPALIGILEGLEDDVSRLRTRSDVIQHRCQPYAGPFGDIGPTLFAGMQDDMTFCRQALQFFERKRHRTRNQPLDRHAPVLEAVGKKSQIFFTRGMRAVHGRDFGDVTTFEFAGQRISRRQETLRGIRQRFPYADNACVIRWYQTVAVGEVNRSANSRCTGRRCYSGSNKSTPCERLAHRAFLSCARYPVIIARTLRQNPARLIMRICTMTKSSSETTKAKCSVRADWCPPIMVANIGNTDVTPNDIARPVHRIPGKSTNTTAI